jgi:flagellar protein FliJ
MREQLTRMRRPDPSVRVRMAQAKSLIVELGRQCRELSSDLDAEEIGTGVHDPKHFAYSPLAKALRERREKLEQSIESLTKTLETAPLEAA